MVVTIILVLILMAALFIDVHLAKTMKATQEMVRLQKHVVKLQKHQIELTQRRLESETEE